MSLFFRLLSAAILWCKLPEEIGMPCDGKVNIFRAGTGELIINPPSPKFEISETDKNLLHFFGAKRRKFLGYFERL